MPSSENSLLTAGLDFCSCAKLEVSATPRKSLSPPFNRCAESLLNNIWWSFSSTCGLGNDVSSSKDCAYQFLTLMVDGISRRPIGEFSRSFTFNARRIGSSSTMKREAKKMEPGDGEGPNWTIWRMLTDVCGYVAYWYIFSLRAFVSSQPVPMLSCSRLFFQKECVVWIPQILPRTKGPGSGEMEKHTVRYCVHVT